MASTCLSHPEAAVVGVLPERLAGEGGPRGVRRILGLVEDVGQLAVYSSHLARRRRRGMLPIQVEHATEIYDAVSIEQ
jgi:hypothetical protein